MSKAGTGAQRRATNTWIATTAMALLAGAALLAAAPAARGQVMDATIGTFTPSTATFALDGNFDLTPDLQVAFGAPGDVALLADIRGTGRRTPALYRNGVWLFDFNADGVLDHAVSFGTATDVPLVADVNGDGRDDLVVYRRGVWYVSTAADGSVQQTYQFGGGRGDIPLLADVNGDGQVDLIVYDRGTWHVSFNRANAIGASYAHGGQAGDKPIAFDYDGDGKAELAVVNNGVWNVKKIGAAPFSFAFGAAGDTPLYFGRGAYLNARLDAARLLHQSTFGPRDADIAAVQAGGPEAWVDNQLNQPASQFEVFHWWPNSRPQTGTTCAYPGYLLGQYNSAFACNCTNGSNLDRCERDLYRTDRLQYEFFRKALTAPDQLRLRTAWALSQILVTSAQQDSQVYPMRDYFQMLVDNAFGRFDTLLTKITLSPWMGNYLDMANNAKGDPVRGTAPNENFAREILQLFSIGLWELADDGTLLRDSQGEPIPSYDQYDITELSRMLTGWTYPAVPGTATTRWQSSPTYKGDMVPCEGTAPCQGTTNWHDTDPAGKNVLGYNFNADARTEAAQVVALLAQHPNVGPFISKQLIQHLVTGNPSPAYVKRVVAVWNNNGAGVKGDLRAVVRAILLDREARTPRNPRGGTFGKLKEPVLYMTNVLRALGVASDGVALRQPAVNMGQNVFNAPTVFNYYTSGYVIPGTALEGPPFEIYDATLYFSRINWVDGLLYNSTCDTGAAWSPALCGPAPDSTYSMNVTATTSTPSTGTKIDWTLPKAYAHDPAALAGWVDTTFHYGTMTSLMRNNIVNAVSAITLASNPTVLQVNQWRLDRARMAVYLGVVAPQYQVEY